MSTIIAFIFGLMIGGMFGAVIMGLLTANFMKEKGEEE